MSTTSISNAVSAIAEHYSGIQSDIEHTTCDVSMVRDSSLHTLIPEYTALLNLMLLAIHPHLQGKPSSSMKGRMDPIKEAGSMPSSRCGDFGQEMPPLLALPIAVMVAASPKEFDWMLTAQKAADGRKEQAARQPCPSGCAMMTVHTSTLVAEPLVVSECGRVPLDGLLSVVKNKQGGALIF